MLAGIDFGEGSEKRAQSDPRVLLAPKAFLYCLSGSPSDGGSTIELPAPHRNAGSMLRSPVHLRYFRPISREMFR